ncbi:MAG TPA: glycosyltransferase 87 family protein [Planctomycetota bacterium]|nr:glycosyltransferase 87 family protein [Planctomycetota bacterium]
MLSPPGRTPLQKASRLAVFALALLVVAGLRHHLVWGESPRLPFSLRPLLDAMETGCVLGFAWFGARAWQRGMAAVREHSPGTKRLILMSLPVLGTALLVPAFLSSDVTDYVMRGRVLALHGGNPYVQVAADFPDDALLAFGDAAWKQFPLPYGPLIADLQAGIAWLAHLFRFLPPLGEFLLAVVLFKAVFAACLVLAALTARSICAVLRPAEQDTVLLGVLWNPLLLNEGVAQAHNEPLVLLMLLLALRATLMARTAAGAFALGLGVLTKVVPVLLAPLWLVWSLRHRRLVGLLLGTAAALLVSGFYYLRFFTDPGALSFVQRQSSVTGASLAWAAASLLHIDVASALTAGRVLVVAIVLAVAVRLWRRPEPPRLVHGCAACLASLVCLGLGNFGPWYHIWWIPLALLAGTGYLRRFAWLATMLSPLCYVVWTGLRTYDARHEWVQLTMGLLLPAIAACIWRPLDQAQPAA